MAKQLMFEDAARAKMLAGVDKLADAVAVTMGPTGRNVIINKSFGGPTVTKDGVTVSKEIELEDPFENMGAKLVHEVADKTSSLAGDGTTTATVLARAILEGRHPQHRRRQQPDGGAARHRERRRRGGRVARLEMRKKVSSKEEIAQVGAISANNDRVIGDLLADAMEKVGKDGVITVEEGKTTETTLEFVEGMQFDKGYLSPYFINEPTDMECVLEDALHPDPRKEDQQSSRVAADPGAGQPEGQAAADHRRRRRRRSPRRLGRQQAARHPERLRRQGPWLWRSPQGDAGRHCDADRRHADSAKTSA